MHGSFLAGAVLRSCKSTADIYAMFKNKLGFIGAMGLLNLPLCLYYSLSYAPNFKTNPWFATADFYLAAIGHFCLYFLIGTLVLIGPLLFFKKKLKIFSFAYMVLVAALLHIVLAVDAHTFSLYRFHLNFAMLDLFFNAGGQVISFSSETIVSIAIEVAVIIVYAALAVGLSALIAFKGFKTRPWVLLCIACYVMANLVNAYASAKVIVPLTEIANRLPLYKPLTMNGTLMKLGIISKEEMVSMKVNISDEGMFDYPKTELAYTENRDNLNVLFVYVDALRGDVFNEENMPNVYALGQKSYVFTDHQSASNSTRGGIFGLFYGIPPAYWQVALASNKPSALVTAAQHQGYRVGAFTSALITKPEFHKTVFSTVEDLRPGSDGDDVLERDDDAINDFMAFVDGHEDERFFSFVFLDNVHASTLPEDFPHPFTPYLRAVNHMELKASTDPGPYFNLYRNAAFYADHNVGRIIDFLEQKDLLKHTIVIISSDHGEEFNDNHDNYWGHNSNFTQAQMHIPLVMYWPDFGKGVISERSTAYDISATLMPRVFGVTNEVSDYSVGQDLLSLKPIDYYIAGSYSENAVVQQDRIVLIDKMGMLRYKDNNYQDIPKGGNDAYLMEALKTLSYYLNKN